MPAGLDTRAFVRGRQRSSNRRRCGAAAHARTTSNNTHDVTSYIKSNNVRARRDDVASRLPQRIATVTFALEPSRAHQLGPLGDRLAEASLALYLAQSAHLRPIWLFSRI